MVPILLAQAPARPTTLLDVLLRFEFWHWMFIGAGLYCGFKALIEGLKALFAARQASRLKREMIARGMSADEIVQVITAGRSDAVDLPCASEVVVESEGNWLPSLVLRAAKGEYYVHYIGNDMDANEWVGLDRIRFPADSQVPRMLAEWQASHPSSDGPPIKGPVMDEV